MPDETDNTKNAGPILSVPMVVTGITLAGDTGNDSDNYYNVNLLPRLPEGEKVWHQARNTITLNLISVDGLLIGKVYQFRLDEIPIATEE